MSCEVQGCRATYPYHYNPTITPLIEYHGKIVQCFDQLPRQGKVKEIAMRILLLVSAPFAYLAISLAALVGIAFDSLMKKNHEKEIQAKIQAEAQSKIVVEKKIPATQGLLGMKNLIGGVEAFEKIPEMKDWNEKMTLKDIKAPLMRGTLTESQSFLLFKYTKVMIDEGSQKWNGAISDTVEFLGWNSENEEWFGTGNKACELNFRSIKPIKKGSLLEKHMFERISRLLDGKPVGILKRYETDEWPIYLEKPENKDEFRPKSSYLKGEDLEAFMDLDCLFYEAAPSMGKTDIAMF